MRRTIEEVKQYFESRHCILLSTEYINTHTPLVYLCPKKHKNKASFISFKRSSRSSCLCSECYRGMVQPKIEDVRKAFQERGCTLLSTKYFNNYSKLDFVCTCGHQHAVSWINFTHCGPCCPECEKENKRRNFDKVERFFIQQGYKLLSNNYVNSKSHLWCECPKEHEYKVTWANFYSLGSRCPICNESKGEKKIAEILSNQKIGFVKEYRLQEGKGSLRLDFFIPSLNIGIEYDGEQHFRPAMRAFGNKTLRQAEKMFKKTQERDTRKNKLCQNKGIRLIRIKYNEDVEERILQLIAKTGEIAKNYLLG